MKLFSVLSFLLVFAFFAATAEADTVSCLRFPDDTTLALASEMLGVELLPEKGSDSQPMVILPEAAAQYLREQGLSFDILWTRTEITVGMPADKAEAVAYGNGSGFAINFRNQQSVTIGHAPANAKVSHVSITLSGVAAYADLCTFSIISSTGKKYTLPKWYDEIWFDHTVSGIQAFKGEKVNQRWTLEGQGSNTAGERVNSWTIGIFYTESSGGNGNENPEGEIIPNPVPVVYWYWWVKCRAPYYAFVEKSVLGQRYLLVDFKLPVMPTNDSCAFHELGRPVFSIDAKTRQIGVQFIPEPNRPCLTVMDPVCAGRTLIGPLSAGTWQFSSRAKNLPPLTESFTVTKVQSHEEKMALVPDVAGKTAAQAKTLIQEAGLKTGVHRYEFSDSVAKDLVIGCGHFYGELVPAGSTVSLIISKGQNTDITDPEGETVREGENGNLGLTDVPNCILLLLAEAKQYIRSAGLQIGTVTEEHHKNIPAGYVSHQYPAANSVVFPGTSVNLTVSLGRTPQIAVPDVTGTDLMDADQRLQHAGMELGRVDFSHDETAPYNQVLEQIPAAGMLVAPGSAVKLVLSKGPLPENGEAIELPNLLLQTLSEAQALLEKTGFSTGSIEKAHDENVPYGRVISQSPSAYRYLPPGTPIDLVISLGAEPRIGVPSLAGMDSLEALDMLEELALVPGIIEQVFDTLIPAGHVSGQDPAPGTRVKKGSSVNLRISNGRDPDELTENEGEGNTDVDPPAREGEPDEALPDEGETTAPDGNEEALPEEGEIPEREKEPVSACDGCSGSGKALGDYLLLGCVMLLLAQSSFFRK